jgi:hypothetical protein
MAKCKEQLHQFDVGIQTYALSYDSQFPPWLSNLYPRTISDLKLYLCPEDPFGGKDGGKPSWEKNAKTAFIETNDYDATVNGNMDQGMDSKDPPAYAVQNHDIKGNSYLYEMCCAECSWWSGSYQWPPLPTQVPPAHRCDFDSNYVPDPAIHPLRTALTWREVKEWEAHNVGPWTPYVRCFWHTGGTFTRVDQVLNVGSYTHHIYISDTTGDSNNRWEIAGGR